MADLGSTYSYPNAAQQAFLPPNIQFTLQTRLSFHDGKHLAAFLRLYVSEHLEFKRLGSDYVAGPFGPEIHICIRKWGKLLYPAECRKSTPITLYCC
jgi:hypothetical protein